MMFKFSSKLNAKDKVYKWGFEYVALKVVKFSSN